MTAGRLRSRLVLAVALLPVVLSWFPLVATAAAPRGASVRAVPGVPVLVGPDGIPFDRLIFAGSGQGLPEEAGKQWREIRYSLLMPIDDPDAFVQINFGSQHGRFAVCDFTLTARKNGAAETVLATSFRNSNWTRDWKLLDPKKTGVNSATDRDGLTVTVPKRMEFPWDIQLCSRRIAVRAGTEYTVVFRVRAEASTPWPLTSYLMRMNPLRFYGASGRDQFLATAAHVVDGPRRIISPLLPLSWPENASDYPAELTLAERYLDTVIRAFPDARLLLRVGVEPPAWWKKRYPDQLQRWENGRTDRYVCAASEQWRRDVRTHLSRLIPLLEKRYGNRIVAYMPVAQSTGEWYYPIWNHADWGSMNHSRPFREGFRRFLKQRYVTIAALNRAWGGPARADFTAIDVPSGAERRVALLPPFRDPSRQRALFDFAEYEQTVMREALENAAAAVKSAAGPACPVFAFYGYTFELSGCRDGIAAAGHLQLRRLLDGGKVDGIVDITSYFDRGAAGSGALMTPVESITARGRILCTEDDSRTHLSALNAGYERTVDADATRWAQTRNLLRSLVHRGYTWKFDLYGGGWFNDAPLWRELEQVERSFAAIRPVAPFRSDVAVVVDEDSFLALRPGIELTRPLVYEFRSVMARSGLGEPSWWLLDDVAAGRVPPHRLTIFLNAFYLDAARKKALAEYCRRSGGQVLWLYAPGYLGTAGEDWAGMTALTGFRFRRLPPEKERTVKIDRPLWRIKTEVGLPAGVADYFTVEPAGNEVLATFASGAPALARSTAAGYPALFWSVPRFDPALLAAIGREAGVWSYTAPGNVVITDGRIMSVTATRPGPIRISLPQPSRITTVDGQEIAARAREFTAAFAVGQTRVFLLAPPAAK